MGKQAEKIIQFLRETGHLQFPFGERSEVQNVKNAIKSYQSMYANELAPLIAKHHSTRSSPETRIDGVVGPAFSKLMKKPRCACPDYTAQSNIEQAQGNGNWKGCHGIGNFHSAIVKFTNKPPSFLRSSIDEIWANVVKTYDDIGLRWRRDDQTRNPNITVSFVQPSGGWIGLAIVGQNQRCNSEIWARFSKNYKPNNLVREWTTLFNHELGHNCGLQHSRGGIMNSYLVQGLKPTWRGDPSFRLLKNKFGGEPIDSKPEPPKPPDPPTPNPPTGDILTSFVHKGETLSVVRNATAGDSWI
ncbi:hypothetical protein OAG36_00585 [bacterium]|nr:hypothetical protein [bacterium]